METQLTNTSVDNMSVNKEQDSNEGHTSVKDPQKIGFHGRGGEYFGIWIVNILLTILTLGIYSAWAKVRTNRYFYGNTELDGDRFEYLATPMQILVGRIIATAMLGVWALTNTFAPTISGLLLLGFFAIFPFLAHKNIRFNMQMTQYRNIRFGFNGTVGGAYMAFLGRPIIAYASMIAIVIAMGAISNVDIEAGAATAMSSGQKTLLAVMGFLVAPIMGALFMWVKVGVDRYLANGMRFGSLDFLAQLSFSKYAIIGLKTFGIGIVIYLVVILVGVLLSVLLGSNETISQLFDAEALQNNPGLVSAMMVPIIFLFLFFGTFVSAYYKAHIRNYVYNQAKLSDKLNLGSSLKAFSFTFIILTNVLAVIFTLGMAIPWAQVRMVRYMAENTSVTGDVALTTAEQANDPKTNAIGDEVAEAFDMEIGLV